MAVTIFKPCCWDVSGVEGGLQGDGGVLKRLVPCGQRPHPDSHTSEQVGNSSSREQGSPRSQFLLPKALPAPLQAPA